MEAKKYGLCRLWVIRGGVYFDADGPLGVILVGAIKCSEYLYGAVYTTFPADEKVRTLLYGRCGSSGDNHGVTRTRA